MKIKIYIVTYRASKDLNNNIKSLLNSDLVNHDYEINVINNHSEFTLSKEFEGKVNVLHNVLRPDFSTGHLARNWNQAIINGFKDLNNPDCDILVTSQDDVIFKSDWTKKLIEYHKKYNFIVMGTGDAFLSYLPEAVKKIGLWDERFFGITHQDADYFLRAIIYNKKKSSINDFQHKRVINPIGDHHVNENIEVFFKKTSKSEINSKEDRVSSPLITVPYSDDCRISEHKRSLTIGRYTTNIFYNKWGIYAKSRDWEGYIDKPPKIISKSYVQYPYFEKNIETLRKQFFLYEPFYDKKKIRNFRQFLYKKLGQLIRFMIKIEFNLKNKINKK